MATFISILEASRMPDEKRVDSEELRSSIESAAERQRRDEEAAVALAARQADDARRTGATRVVDFYMVDGSTGFFKSEPRLDAYYSSVAVAGKLANAGVEALYMPQETTRARIMKAHGLQAYVHNSKRKTPLFKRNAPSLNQMRTQSPPGLNFQGCCSDRDCLCL